MAAHITRREAYVSMITSDDFCPGIEALLGSLKSSQKDIAVDKRRPILVMVTSGVSKRVKDKIIKTGAEIIQIESIAIPDKLQTTEEIDDNNTSASHVESWITTGYSKLCLWSLGMKDKGSYEALLYIDADAVVLEDLSPLFSKLSKSNTFIAAPDIFPPDKFNAGVMGIWIDPIYPELLFQDMLLKIHQLKSYDGGDTGFLNAYFPNWFIGGNHRCENDEEDFEKTKKQTNVNCANVSNIDNLVCATSEPIQGTILTNNNDGEEEIKCLLNYFNFSNDSKLPFRYNAQRTLHWLTNDKQPGYWAINEPYAIIHFSSSPKPWQVPKQKGELELIWWQCFMKSQIPDLGTALGF